MQTIKQNIILLKNSKKIIGKYKKEKKFFFIFQDQSELKSSEVMNNECNIYCDECGKECKIKLYWGILNKNFYLCQSCKSKGEKNGFYGKKHSKTFKMKLSKERKGTWGVGESNPMYGRNIFDEKTEEEIQLIKNKLSNSCRGEKNGFYGKTHSEETKILLKEKTMLWLEKLTEDEKNTISKKISESHTRQKEENIEKYRQNKIKAAKFSHISQFKNMKMNKIENIVYNELKNRNLDFQYSVILGRNQFDFGNKKYRILLEVHGDYWHGNEDIYGEFKTPLNEIQKNKIRMDVIKNNFAEKNNFKLFIIWENDIRNENFSVIDQICEYINSVDN